MRLPLAGAALCAAVLVAVPAFQACGDGTSSATTVPLHGAVTDPAVDVGDVVLADTSAGGAPFALAAQPGHVLLLYFGFTNCPDLCPTTLSTVRKVREDLGDDADRVDVAMATVDPGRDTPEILTSYLSHFFTDAHALRSDDPATLSGAEAAFGITVTTQPTDVPGYYTVDHKASLYAIDDEGRVLVEWPQGTSREAIAQDVGTILGERT